MNSVLLKVIVVSIGNFLYAIENTDVIIFLKKGPVTNEVQSTRLQMAIIFFPILSCDSDFS